MINTIQQAALAITLSLSAATSFGQSLFVEPTSINFGKKVLTEPGSRAVTVTLATNNYGGSMAIDKVQLLGPFSSNFTISAEPSYEPLPLVTQGNTQMAVTYNPVHMGTRAATLQIVTRNPVTTKTVQLVGTGVDPLSSPYFGPYTGVGPGSSTIGQGGDYQTLADACQAVTNQNSLTGGDWQFLLQGEILETQPSYLAAYHTNGHAIEFRPASESPTTVSLTGDAKLIVGRSNSTDYYTEPSISTHNISINGGAESSPRTPVLTIQNDGTAGAGSLIQVVGDCDNFTLRNTRLICRPNSADAYAAIELFSDRYPYTPIVTIQGIGTSTGNFSDSCTIRDCSIEVTDGGVVSGVAATFAPAAQPWQSSFLVPGISNINVSNNSIRTNSSVIVVSPAVDCSFEGNNITVEPDFAYYDPQTLFGAVHIYGSPYLTTSTMYNINANTINFLDAETTHSLAGISFQGTTTTSTVTVTNNMITGLTSSAPPANQVRRAIAYGSASSNTTAVIAHNSILMHGSSTTSPHMTSAIGSTDSQNFPFQGSLSAVNNIVSLRISGAAVFRPSPYGTHHSNNNNLFIADGAVIGYDSSSSSVYPTINSWQTATGNDLASISQDPFVPASPGAGVWIGPAGDIKADLHFTSFPGSDYLVPPVPAALTDVDNEPRISAQAIMGADEVPQLSAVTSWSLY